MHFGSVDPRGPNFAEIHARGRRGRLESEPRDLIPPWMYRLLHGETEKPTMPVWLDRNGGALPSRRTGMVGKDNCSTAAHGGTMVDNRQPIQETFGESTAEKAVAAVHNRCSPGPFRAELCAWMPSFRAKRSPDSDLIRAATGIIWLYSGSKEGIRAKNSSVDGHVRGKKAPFFRTARLIWAAFSRKTAGKSRRRV